MNYRNEIKDIALTVNDGLTAYIAVHNAIFRDSATFKSFLKNLTGRGVPMSKLLSDSEALLPLWDTIQQEVDVFRQSSYSFLSKDEQHYYDILSRYVKSVRKTVIALIERQQLMNEGSKGRSGNPMTWNAFQEKEDNYQQSVQEYMAIGQELNNAAHLIY
ncbi:hypothetical protein JXA32_01760 [Candidatus Sumerlaeota bacterium]|nr:hypothetical protein [Candidatus Sumerlaeota bacterium]